MPGGQKEGPGDAGENHLTPNPSKSHTKPRVWLIFFGVSADAAVIVRRTLPKTCRGTVLQLRTLTTYCATFLRRVLRADGIERRGARLVVVLRRDPCGRAADRGNPELINVAAVV